MLSYDMSNLKHLATLGQQAPAAMQAFQSLSDSAFGDGVIDPKTKEMIALAVAISKQCPYCIEVHSGNARKHGVSDAEVAELTLIAAAIGAGAAVTHGTHALG